MSKLDRYLQGIKEYAVGVVNGTGETSKFEGSYGSSWDSTETQEILRCVRTSLFAEHKQDLKDHREKRISDEEMHVRGQIYQAASEYVTRRLGWWKTHQFLRR